MMKIEKKRKENYIANMCSAMHGKEIGLPIIGIYITQRTLKLEHKMCELLKEKC